jgi:hypothetical protein
MFFLISVTVAAAAINSECHVKKGSHAEKKVKKVVDPDIAAGKTELTPLQANKYNLGDYAGSSTTIDTPDGASNTINMGVNSGIQFDDGPYPGNRILEGDHVGTSFNFGNYPGITFNDAPKNGFAGITVINASDLGPTGKPLTLFSSISDENRQHPVQNKAKHVNMTFTDTKIPLRGNDQ